MNTSLFFNTLPYTLLALLLWPLAHIPLGTPMFLAVREKQETGPWVLAGSLAVGQTLLAALTYLFYICGLRFPTLGFVVAGVLLPVWAWGALLLIKNPPKLSGSRWLILGLAFTAVILLCYSVMGAVTDDGYHFSKVASILNGDHPYFVPGGTQGFLRCYHFGVDFLASFWAWGALAWRPWVVLNTICFWSALSAYVLFHRFARGFLEEPWASILPLLVFWLGAWYSPYGLWDMLANRQSWFAVDMNCYNTSFFGYFFQPPMAFGMPLMLSALCLAEERRFWRAGLMAGPLLLANQALFVFWAGYTALVGLIKEKNYFRVLAIGIAIAVPFLPHLTAREFSNTTSFAFGLPTLRLMRVWEPYPATFPLAYILFFFPLLPFYLHGVWLSLRDKQTRLIFLPIVLITGLTFVAPHFISYVHTEDFFKFFMLWGIFGLPLVLLSVKKLWKHTAWKWLMILAMAPGFFSYSAGFSLASLRTRRLMGWEKLRPDIIRVNEALRGKGGVLMIMPPGLVRFGIYAYTDVSGKTVPSTFDSKLAEKNQRIIVGAGIPCYPGVIYGRAVLNYRPLEREWASLEEIPDSLLDVLNVRFVALPSGAPQPAIADEPLIRTDNIAVYPLR